MLGVKYSCAMFAEVDHVWTQHLEQARDIRAKAGRPVKIHGRPSRFQARRLVCITPGTEKDLDFVWPSLRWVYGSSGFGAALWARHGMGFDEVILCGVPMVPGGYAAEVGAFKRPNGDAGKSFADLPVLERWRGVITEFITQGKCGGITSMSGWTREVLGAPV